ncbi:MAG: hypothetical protein WBA45_11615 [Microthrixaceae bacterium]
MSSVETVPATGSIDRVVLEVPATTDHLRMVRLLVSAIATSHGADLNDLEDLRIASGELCAHLINEAPGEARMTVVAEIFAGEGAESPWLLLRATVPNADSLIDFDDISSMVLAAASDEFGIGAHLGRNETRPEDYPGPDEMASMSSAWFRRHVRAAPVRRSAAG